MKIRRRRKRILLLSIVSILFVFLLVRTIYNVTSVLKSIAEATMRSITTEAVNDAIYYTLSDNLRYEDLISVERGSKGEILSITSNSLQINRIARDTAYMSQKNLNEMSRVGINIPIGAFTGIELIAGMGPKVNLKIIPISNVECRFVSSFDSVGINQTKHSIYLEIVSDISIIMLKETSNFASTTEVLICESVIVGEVPEVFLQSDLFSQR